MLICTLSIDNYFIYNVSCGFAVRYSCLYTIVYIYNDLNCSFPCRNVVFNGGFVLPVTWSSRGRRTSVRDCIPRPSLLITHHWQWRARNGGEFSSNTRLDERLTVCLSRGIFNRDLKGFLYRSHRRIFFFVGLNILF